MDIELVEEHVLSKLLIWELASYFGGKGGVRSVTHEVAVPGDGMDESQTISEQEHCFFENTLSFFLELEIDLVPFIVHVDEWVRAVVDVVLILHCSRAEDKPWDYIDQVSERILNQRCRF